MNHEAFPIVLPYDAVRSLFVYCYSQLHYLSDGFLTYYAHCSSLYVSAGQSVTKGQNICAVGLTGNTSGYHVHFEVRYNGTSVNPMNYM